MHRGYIKIWRKIEDSGLLQMHSTLSLFIHMLMQASHKPLNIGMKFVDRGQFISGRHKLAENIGVSEQQVRTCLEKLHMLKMVTSKPTNKFTLYTIINYGQYQDCNTDANQQVNQQVTNNQPTSNQQVTTIQEAKHLNIKEDKYIPPINGDLLKDWLEVRKAKRAGKLTETAFKGLQREAGLAGLSDEQAVKVCCERSWQSFKAEWYIKQPKSQNVQEARLDTARQIFGGQNGTNRQAFDIDSIRTIESDGESVSKAIPRLR